MAYLVLARKWRPQTFDEVVGQNHIIQTLKNALQNGRLAHAYLFTGPRGIGKTSVARILAKAVNCQEGPTSQPCGQCLLCRQITEGEEIEALREIDGASNRGIEEVRQLRENVKFIPVTGRYKVYIIDEVHMLTPEAFNALLKTLEEPPPHVIFVLVTTEPHRIPLTIVSRCQRFDFRRLSVRELVARLERVAREEKVAITSEALYLIAHQSEGSLRDAESMLDQLISYKGNEIAISDVRAMLGMVSRETFDFFLDIIRRRDTAQGIDLVEELTNAGYDPRQFLRDLMGYLRNLLLVKIHSRPEALIDLTDEEIEKFRMLAEKFTAEELLVIIQIVSKAEEELRRTANPRLVLELTFMRLTRMERILSWEEILSRLEDLYQQVKSMGGKDVPLPISSLVDQPEKEKKELVNDNNLSPEQILQQWSRILEEVKSERRALAEFLLHGEPIAVKDGTIILGFPQNLAFSKEGIEKPENRKILEESLKKILQNDYRIKCTLINSRESTSSPSPLEEPMIRKVMEIFQGEIVGVSPISSVEEA